MAQVAELFSQVPQNPLDCPSAKLINIVPNDGEAQEYKIRAIYVGVAGDISLKCRGSDTPVVFKSVPQGVIIGPFFCDYVMATGTNASNLVGFC